MARMLLEKEEDLEKGRSLDEVYEARKGLFKTFDNSMFNTHEGAKVSEELFERHMRSIKTSLKTKII